jgi:hypothetical protein
MVVLASAPTGDLTPGATYTTNFGTDDPSSAPAGTTPPATAGGTGATGATGAGAAVAAKVAPTTFRAEASGPATATTGPGAQLTFTLAGQATVVFTVQRKVAGRRAGRRCVAQKASNRRRKACALTRRIGSFKTLGSAGPNVLRFRGRVDGRALAPGAYQLVIVATDASRTASAPRTISFRILRGARR